MLLFKVEIASENSIKNLKKIIKEKDEDKILLQEDRIEV